MHTHLVRSSSYKAGDMAQARGGGLTLTLTLTSGDRVKPQALIALSRDLPSLHP